MICDKTQNVKREKLFLTQTASLKMLTKIMCVHIQVCKVTVILTKNNDFFVPIQKRNYIPITYRAEDPSITLNGICNQPSFFITTS